MSDRELLQEAKATLKFLHDWLADMHDTKRQGCKFDLNIKDRGDGCMACIAQEKIGDLPDRIESRLAEPEVEREVLVTPKAKGPVIRYAIFIGRKKMSVQRGHVYEDQRLIIETVKEDKP